MLGLKLNDSYPKAFAAMLRNLFPFQESGLFVREGFDSEVVPHAVYSKAGELSLYWHVKNISEVDGERITRIKDFVQWSLENTGPGRDALSDQVKSFLVECGVEENTPCYGDDYDEDESAAGLEASRVLSRIRLFIVGSNLPSALEPALLEVVESTPAAFINKIPLYIKAVLSPLALDHLRELAVLPPHVTMQNSRVGQLVMATVRFGDLYRDLREPLGVFLYEANIRESLGCTTITNGRLAKSYERIACEGEDSDSFLLFPFKNNGITMSCLGFRGNESEPNIYLSMPQILNGQQTIECWLTCREKFRDDQRKVAVLDALPIMVRIIKLSSSKVVADVAFSNNRQNAVSALDLRSNDSCMKDVEAGFRLLKDSGDLCVEFRRKSGINNRGNSINGKDLHQLLATVEERDGAEAYFDQGDQFEQDFRGLALALGDPVKAKRLVGLLNVMWIRLGARKKPAIIKLLTRLGVHGSSMGVDRDEQDPNERRLLVYALWPSIQKVFIHWLLSNPDWQGSATVITALSKPKAGKRARWEPSNELCSLLQTIRLDSDLFTRIWQQFKEWKDDPANVDEEQPIESFVEEVLSLDTMMAMVGVRPRMLLENL